jgi:RND family efflux transporter MFP subunit
MKKLVLVVLIVAVALGAWYWFGRGGSSEAEEEAKPTAEIETAAAKQQPISETLAAYGVAEATPAGNQVVTLAYDCTVKNAAVSVGSRVAAGDLVLEVSPTADAQLLFDTSRADLTLAQKALAGVQKRFDLRLAASQELLSAQQAAEDAAIKVKSLEQRGLAGDGRILARETGIVTKFDFQTGAMVPAGTALAVISGSSHLEAHLAIEAADSSRVKAGQKVSLASASRPDLAAADSAIRLVGASVDPVSGSTDAWAALPADGGWLAGEHIRAEIVLQTKDALVVPRSAVLPEEGGNVLFTVKDGKAVKHTVEVGIAADDLLEVVSKDLHPGDPVVTVGNYELEDGMAVRLAGAESKEGGKSDEESGKTEKPDESKAKEEAKQ